MEDIEPIPLELGEFEVVREIGQGVMGVVYEAWQPSLNRRVALKTLSQGLGLTAKGIRRFHQVLQAVSQLEHTHLVTVRSWGELGLVPYYTMDLVEGPSLDRLIRRLKREKLGLRESDSVAYTAGSRTDCPDWAARSLIEMPAEETSNGDPRDPQPADYRESPRLRFEVIAERVAGVADAVARAHLRGVYHLDIKPSNLILSPDGRLLINDFSLARSLESPGMTFRGGWMGSACYLSPEQVVRGEIPVDHRSDVYSLGAVLYELITLSLPFDGDRRAVVLDRIVQGEPTPPRRMDPSIPLDLETICLKALDCDPEQRYQSADELAGDLRRFAEHHRITAEPVSSLRQSVRWCRRHWTATAAAFIAMISLFFLAMGSVEVGKKVRERRVASKHERLSKAILLSLAGYERGLEGNLKVSTRQGMETWLAKVLRGQCYLQSRNLERALTELVSAEEMEADNLQVLTLLETTYAELGRWELAHDVREQMQGILPSNTRDKLYLGSWLSRTDPQRGLELVAQGYEEAKPNEADVARLLESAARWRAVQDHGSPDDAQSAVYEAAQVRGRLSGNSYARLVEIQTLLVASHVFRRADEQLQASELRAVASVSLRELDEWFTDSPATAQAWFWHGCVQETPAERLRAFERSCQLYEEQSRSIPRRLLVAYAWELYLHGQFDEALECLRRYPNQASSETLLPSLLAIESKRDLNESLAEVPASLPQTVHEQSWRLPLGLLVLREPRRARSMFEQLDSADRPVESQLLDRLATARLQRLLGYGSGRISEQELLHEPPATNSNLWQSDAHFLIAMHMLPCDQYDEAEEHFQACLEAGIFTSEAYHISRAFLRKLGKSWPPRITNTHEDKRCD